jgi:transcriptional regulator with XRE-family HTH domain
MSNIGENIKKIRIEKGLTQKQLGDLCGMKDSQIRRYENGRANPKYETIEKIAKALNVSTMRIRFDHVDIKEDWKDPVFNSYVRSLGYDLDSNTNEDGDISIYISGNGINECISVELFSELEKSCSDYLNYLLTKIYK